VRIQARRLVAAVGILFVSSLLLLLLVPGVVARPAQQAQRTVDAETVHGGPSSTLFSYQGQLLDASGEPVEGSVEMTFALYQAAEGGTPFWTETYSGTQSVAVSRGLFHVLLGSLVPLDSADLTGDLYLELAVGGETLTPRELLTSVAHAVAADGIAGDLDMRGNDILNGRVARFEEVGIGRDPVGEGGSLAVGGRILVGDQGFISATVDSGGQGPHMVFQTDNVFVFQTDEGGRLRVSGNQDGLSLEGLGGFSFGGPVEPGADAQYDLGSADLRWGTAYLQSAWCGALVEANLQTEEEQKADRIDRFEEGDVLCWSPAGGHLERCTAADDRLVQAVADPEGRPIVLGAEVVKVIGPVRAGDYLVSSEVPGYAMASPDPGFGTVIAQALEDLEGERGLVKAMIRKM
jgi:hypothetical protein